MKKIKIGIFIVLFLFYWIANSPVQADSVTDNAINFLKAKQEQSGQIIGGFSSPSQWSAIAFSAAGIDINTIKNPDNSLNDFLLKDIPTTDSPTDWENRILAITAAGEDPTNFGGTNYIQKLESYYNNSQIGDTCALNDDVFGLLAFIAGGSSQNQIKQNVLDFLIKNQDKNGGFSWSAPGCSWYSTSPDMTAAAIQALKTAKDNNFTNQNLDISIEKAKDFLLANQNTDGGFGYSGASDADTTGWVLMAFNVLGLKDSVEAVNAKNWLISKQQADGGFPGWSGSDSTTTAQAVIGLLGKWWILRVSTPTITPPVSITPSPTVTIIPSPIPSSTPTPTPTPTAIPASSQTASPTPTPTITPTSTPSQTFNIAYESNQEEPKEEMTPTKEPQKKVLGETMSNKPKIVKIENLQSKTYILFFGISSIAFLSAFLYWKFKMRS
ncbi:MAG: terpene cyclase/mutase family protein [Patescibacteria group bacterium]|nr:terpene cyclase/mutase family protein [Patescibacteria group bacterium]